MDLISVIVPVYQVDKYLEECVNSIINQTYRNLEIILIDDGSTDKSGEICDSFAKMDNRVIVIHQDNNGVSSARNKGLDIAKGEYYCFVDSDDYIKDTFVDSLYQMIKRNNAEISICDYTRTENLEGSNNKYIEEYSISSDRMLSEWHRKRSRIESVVWNKMYHKSIFSGENGLICFPFGKIHEDVYISHLLIDNAKNIAITNKVLYFYRDNSNSITNKKRNKEVRKQDLDAQKARIRFFKSKRKYGTYLILSVLYVFHFLFW